MTDYKCEACGDTASTYCQDCTNLLCLQCLKIHKATSAFSSHRTLDLTRQDDKNTVAKYILCPDHHIAINYYCKNCKRGTCRLCIPKSHSSHEAEPLQNVANVCLDNLDELQKSLHGLAESILNTTEQPVELEALGKSMLAEAEEHFRAQTEECRASVAEWELKTKEDLKGRQQLLVDDVMLLSNRRHEHLSNIQNTEDEINALKSMDRPLEVIDKLDNVRKVVESLKAKSTDIQSGTFVRGAKFTPEPIPVSMGEFSEVAIGPASERERLTFWTKAKRGTSMGELLSPCDVLFLPGGELLLADWGNSRVQRFCSSGDIATVILNDLNPERLAATQDNLVLVTDDKRREVLSFTHDGKIVNEWKPENMVKPWGLAVNRDSSRVVTDYTQSKGYIFSPEQALIGTFGGHSNFSKEGPWLLNLPTYVACDLHGRIIVSDCNNHSIKIFDASGSFLTSFGKRGAGNGQFRYPRGVALDQSNNIIVADWGNDRISQFSSNGQFIHHIFTPEMTEQFGWPYGLSFLSGVFNDGKPRLAITTEKPDALLIIPYEYKDQTQEAGDSGDTSLDISNLTTDPESPKPTELNTTLDETIESNDTDPRLNRRKIAYGSSHGSGRSILRENVKSPSSLFVVKTPDSVRQSLDIGRIAMPTVYNPMSPKVENLKSPRADNPKSPRTDNPKSTKAYKPRLRRADNPMSSMRDNPKSPRSYKPRSPRAERQHSGSSITPELVSPTLGIDQANRKKLGKSRKSKRKKAREDTPKESSLDSIPEDLVVPP